jgi:uncharacterized protein YbjT (DUF2867 family)
MRIVVIGGSGRVGVNVVARLAEQGHEAVAASRSTGVDAVTGEGLVDVMAGAQVVMDVSGASVADDRGVLGFFITSTHNMLVAEHAAGVRHHLALTIVGADRLPGSGYMRAKVAQEVLISAGSTPYTILRATQFFEFLAEIAEWGARGDEVRLSTGLLQPVAVDEVGATMTELATCTPVNGIIDLAGPEALGVDAWARRLFAATGDARTVVSDPHALYAGAVLHDGELLPGDGARIGRIDFDRWFAAQPRTSSAAQ